MKGAFNQLYNLKKTNRGLKVYLSIGGWSYRDHFAPGLNTGVKRRKFAISAVTLLKDLGLDGIDIDWEFPRNTRERYYFVMILKDIRLILNQYASSIGVSQDQFELSIAAPATPDSLQYLDIKAMDQYLNYWNVMCYDFSGDWDSDVLFQSNLYGGSVSCNAAMQYYLKSGATSSKLVLGIPTYGVGFSNTFGIGRPFHGMSTGSGQDPGNWNYDRLPLPGCQEYVEMCQISAYCYDRNSKSAVVYDNEETVRYKAEYVVDKNLGGGMFWEASMDAPFASNRSLVRSFDEAINYQVNNKPNCISYPKSKYFNIRFNTPPDQCPPLRPSPPKTTSKRKVTVTRMKTVVVSHTSTPSSPKIPLLVAPNFEASGSNARSGKTVTVTSTVCPESSSFISLLAYTAPVHNF